MTDDEIRSLVRVAIQKHLGPAALPTDRRGASSDAPAAAIAPPQPPPLSISFSRYVLPRADDDTMCIIEAEVKCNHCGYCQCHGH
jgi:hypothetical protein